MSQAQKPQFGPPTDVKSVLTMHKRPKKAVITAGMPYANGPLHLGHLAGAHVPADIYARWMRMLIGAENVLFVNGNDDHGSTSEVAANKAGKTRLRRIKREKSLSATGCSGLAGLFA